MKSKSFIITGAVVAAIAMCGPVTAFAAQKKDKAAAPAAAAEPAASPTAKAPRAIPLKGMIASVDAKTKTFTIAGKEKERTFKITSTTVITKAGAPATMKDMVANEEIRGSYYKMADGSMEAKTLKLGPLTDAEKAEKEARKEKRAEKKAAKEAAPAASASPKP